MRIVNPLRFYCFIFAFMCFFGLLTSSFFTGVQGSSENEYETVYVCSGDTLWSIAQTYKPERVKLQTYIEEVKKCNQMTNSTLYAGSTIVIPIYPEIL